MLLQFGTIEVVLHYAIADYFPNKGLGHKRIMDRIAIRGERPY